MTTPMKISLDIRKDRNQKEFYIGWCAAPVKLSFKTGVAFMVFVSEDGYEEIHICSARQGSRFSQIKKSINSEGETERYFVSLEKKIDDFNNPFYIAVVQDDNLEIPLDEPGMVFMVFTSREGYEQIQIVKNKQEKKEHRPNLSKTSDCEIEYYPVRAAGIR